MSNLQALAQKLITLDDKIAECMRCGLCQSVCPMYGASGEEGDVARGKLVLINNLSHLLLQNPQALAEKLGRCLLCSSCQAACPAGVNIMEIFRQAREVVYNYLGLSIAKKMIFRTLLGNPGLFNFSISLAAPVQNLLFIKSGPEQPTLTSPMLKGIIGERHIPRLASKTLFDRTGNMDEERRKEGLKVAFFPGCVGDKMYVDMSLACIKALKHHKVAIYLPENLSCCGIPAVCSGDAEGMLKTLRKNLDILSRADFDYLVTPCASCTSTIKELWPEYARRLDNKYAEIANAIAGKTMDINVFMVKKLGVKAVKPGQDAKKITYHDPCHLSKALGIRSEPRTVLQANPQYAFEEMAEHDRCCGCGGSFTLFHYDWSRKIGQRKRDNIVKSKADVVATSCPACMMQLENILALNHDRTQVRHTMQIYADSLEEQK